MFVYQLQSLSVINNIQLFFSSSVYTHRDVSSLNTLAEQNRSVGIRTYRQVTMVSRQVSYKQTHKLRIKKSVCCWRTGSLLWSKPPWQSSPLRFQPAASLLSMRGQLMRLSDYKQQVISADTQEPPAPCQTSTHTRCFLANMQCLISRRNDTVCCPPLSKDSPE